MNKLFLQAERQGYVFLETSIFDRVMDNKTTFKVLPKNFMWNWEVKLTIKITVNG